GGLNLEAKRERPDLRRWEVRIEPGWILSQEGGGAERRSGGLVDAVGERIREQVRDQRPSAIVRIGYVGAGAESAGFLRIVVRIRVVQTKPGAQHDLFGQPVSHAEP